jgi:DNA-directed RNA polymerase subunit RPC12/RpoP
MLVRCPDCHSRAIHRSKRRGMFELSLLGLVPMRPYRCEECDRRFYAFASLTKSIPSNTEASR